LIIAFKKRIGGLWQKKKRGGKESDALFQAQPTRGKGNGDKKGGEGQEAVARHHFFLGLIKGRWTVLPLVTGKKGERPYLFS